MKCMFVSLDDMANHEQLFFDTIYIQGDFDFDDMSSLTTSDHDRAVLQEMASREEDAFERLI